MLKKMGCWFILLCCLMLTACSNASESREEPSDMIEWCDFIKFNDITYTSYREAGLKLTKEDLDKELYKVKFNVLNNVHDHTYKIKNGDAAFLPVNTKVYSIKGYNSDFYLAVLNSNGAIALYVVDNPKAQKGEDLLDIRDKVESISIKNKGEGEIEFKDIASITDKKIIDKIVDMILKAPVDVKPREFNNKRYFIELQLKRGVNLGYWYYVDTGEYYYGIILPKEFVEIINKAVDVKK